MIAGVLFDLFHTLTGREAEWSELPLTSQVLVTTAMDRVGA